MYRKYLKNSLLYTLSTIISKAIPFLLLPVFTLYLSKEDYGTLGLIMSIAAIVNIYIGLKPSLFLIVKAPQLKKTETSQYIFNSFIISIYSFVVIFFILFFIQSVFFIQIPLYIFFLIAVMSLFLVSNEVLETIFQVEKKALNYATYQLLKVIFSVALALSFIIIFKMGWEGKYFADLIVTISFAFYAIYYLYKNHYINIKFDFIKQKELVKYLSPLTFHVLGLVLMSSIDRIFLANMVGLEFTGIYTIAYTIGATVGIVHDSLLKVWSPEFYKRIKNATIETKIKILKFQYFYIVGSFFMFGVFFIIYPYIFHLMVNDKFNSALNIIPIIALGLTFESLRKLFIGYHYNLGKNTRIAILTLVAGIVNAILNYILIPTYGINGAAYATVIAYILVFIFTIIDINIIEKINWRLKND